jgi:ABC-type lipoprotein export system ATPase subunit
VNSPDPSLHIETLTLRNFTCFKHEKLSFVPGVNVFVGPNGTGKTHVLKALYASQKTNYPGTRPSVFEVLKGLFQIDDLGELRSKAVDSDQLTEVFGTYGKAPWRFGILEGMPQPVLPGANRSPEHRPVFIPTIDMIGHSKGFLESSNLVELDFDSTCIDLLSLLGSKNRSTPSGRHEIVKKLSEVVDGEIDQDESKRFYLSNERGRFPMPMIAEGIRKVATLKRLVENNWLTPGSALFWDEPELNLNPQIMDEVAQAILLIARTGVQVFLASHSYLILKELEVNKQFEDSLRFFAFDGIDGNTIVRSAEDYLGLSPNPIEAQYADIYNRQISREIESIQVGAVREGI